MKMGISSERGIKSTVAIEGVRNLEAVGAREHGRGRSLGAEKVDTHN
jgi:hypothetical protein